MQGAIKHRVAVVTDSTADLPRNLLQEYGIHVVPQILILGERTWLDGVDIDPPAFYELLRSSSQFPSTSQVTVPTFQEVFSRLAKEADGIVAVLVSSELSGTLNSALAAADSLPEIAIQVVDSRGVSMYLGFVALAAARAAAAGGDLQAVADAARRLVGKVQLYFVVDTLEYLYRGGRIGAAARLVGTALSLKPVLEMRDGIVAPVAKIRTRRKALTTMLELMEEQLQGGGDVHMAVLHIACPDEAAQLASEVTARFRPVELITSECGPVVGTHAGPGTVGVAYFVD